MATKEQLLALAIQELPLIIGLLKGAFKRDNPQAPPPTDAEVLAAWNAAFAKSLSEDQEYLATHKRTDEGGGN